MSRLQKDIAGWLLLVGFIAVPVVLWQSYTGTSAWASTSSSLRSIGQLSGLIGASLFSLNFILAARLGWVEELMSGLPRIYTFHHFSGIAALILLLMHPLFLGLQYLPFSFSLVVDFFVPDFSDKPKLLGAIALLTIVVLLFITLFMRIAYHKWKATHQWLGLALLLASLHVYLIPGHLSSAPGLRYYMVSVIIAGLVAFTYRVLFGRWLIRRYPYKVNKVNVHDNGTEVILSPLGKPVRYKAGQFFFIRVHDAAEVSKESHPFSFTSPPGKKYISFTAKPIGDYTATLKLLSPKTTVDIEGPYGRFIFNDARQNQVWIAGGIGITPFMSRARELLDGQQARVTLYYIVRNKKDAIFLKELTDIAAKNNNFELRVWESSKKGRLSTDDIIEVNDAAPRSYFICGPDLMMKSLKQGLLKAGVNRGDIYTEEFKLY